MTPSDPSSPKPAAEPDQDDSDDTQRTTMIAIVLLLVFIAIGWFVIDQLYDNNKLQDCFMQGRRNCAPADGDAK